MLFKKENFTKLQHIKHKGQHIIQTYSSYWFRRTNRLSYWSSSNFVVTDLLIPFWREMKRKRWKWQFFMIGHGQSWENSSETDFDWPWPITRTKIPQTRQRREKSTKIGRCTVLFKSAEVSRKRDRQLFHSMTSATIPWQVLYFVTPPLNWCLFCSLAFCHRWIE